jgi:hypothetical protein
MFPLAGHMFALSEGAEVGDLSGAIPAAVERGAERMIDPPLGEYEGLPGLRRLTAEIGDWPKATEDWQWCARFNYQVIERRGTGGGNFRTMYARFLEEAGYAEADLAAEASGLWTELAGALREASEADDPDPPLWEAISARAQAVLEAEERLWTALAA